MTLNSQDAASIQAQIAMLQRRLNVVSGVTPSTLPHPPPAGASGTPLVPPPTNSTLIDRHPLNINIVEKPQGSAGRSYTLNKVLGLTDSEHKMIRGDIETIAGRHLNTDRCMSEQINGKITETINEVLAKYPEFRRLKDPEWPVRQYLRMILKGSSERYRGNHGLVKPKEKGKSTTTKASKSTKPVTTEQRIGKAKSKNPEPEPESEPEPEPKPEPAPAPEPEPEPTAEPTADRDEPMRKDGEESDGDQGTSEDDQEHEPSPPRPKKPAATRTSASGKKRKAPEDLTDDSDTIPQDKVERTSSKSRSVGPPARPANKKTRGPTTEPEVEPTTNRTTKPRPKMRPVPDAAPANPGLPGNSKRKRAEDEPSPSPSDPMPTPKKPKTTKQKKNTSVVSTPARSKLQKNFGSPIAAVLTPTPKRNPPRAVNARKEDKEKAKVSQVPKKAQNKRKGK